jgi:uncharacterized protein YacL
MLLWLLRGAYVAMMAGVAGIAFLFFTSDVPSDSGGGFAAGLAAAAVVLAIGGLVMFTDIREKNKEITTISAVYFGLMLGLFLGWLLSLALEPIAHSIAGKLPEAQQLRLVLMGRVMLTVICCYVSISTLLQTKDEFRFIIPYVEFSKQVKGGRPLVLDWWTRSSSCRGSCCKNCRASPIAATR